MAETTQISAHITIETKERMERYVRSTGITRAHLVEQALRHHLQVLESLPAEAVIPTRLVLSGKSAKRVREATTRPAKPTAAMRRLFDDR